MEMIKKKTKIKKAAIKNKVRKVVKKVGKAGLAAVKKVQKSAGVKILKSRKRK